MQLRVIIYKFKIFQNKWFIFPFSYKFPLLPLSYKINPICPPYKFLWLENQKKLLKILQKNGIFIFDFLVDFFMLFLLNFELFDLLEGSIYIGNNTTMLIFTPKINFLIFLLRKKIKLKLLYC